MVGPDGRSARRRASTASREPERMRDAPPRLFMTGTHLGVLRSMRADVMDRAWNCGGCVGAWVRGRSSVGDVRALEKRVEGEAPPPRKAGTSAGVPGDRGQSVRPRRRRMKQKGNGRDIRSRPLRVVLSVCCGGSQVEGVDTGGTPVPLAGVDQRRRRAIASRPAPASTIVPGPGTIMSWTPSASRE